MSIYLFSSSAYSTNRWDVEIIIELSKNKSKEVCTDSLIKLVSNKILSLQVRMADWVKTLSLDAYFITYFGFRVLFVHLIPCTSLVVLNVLLFRAMRAAQINRQKLFKENRKSECKRLRDSNCTTLMLIVVVTVFLMVEIPVAVVTILHIISSTMVEILDYSIANVLILVTNFFIIVSYPINFAIYCGMSRQFRETFKELFIRGAVTSRKNGGSSRYSLVNGPRTCTNETVL